MTDPIDDKDEAAERARDEKSGEGTKGKSGSTGGAGGMKFSSEETEESAEARRKKKGDSGEGDSDSWGRGKAGSGAGAGTARLSEQKNQEVKSEHRHLQAGELINAIAEFFSALPMRASANLSVTWEKTKTNVKSFAIVNWIIEFGDKTVRELAKTRERGASRDTRGLQRQRPPKARPGMSIKLDPNGPSGPTGQ